MKIKISRDELVKSKGNIEIPKRVIKHHMSEVQCKKIANLLLDTTVKKMKESS